MQYANLPRQCYIFKIQTPIGYQNWSWEIINFSINLSTISQEINSSCHITGKYNIGRFDKFIHSHVRFIHNLRYLVFVFYWIWKAEKVFLPAPYIRANTIIGLKYQRTPSFFTNVASYFSEAASYSSMEPLMCSGV